MRYKTGFYNAYNLCYKNVGEFDVSYKNVEKSGYCFLMYHRRCSPKYAAIKK
jgi:hypothetical protein